MPQANTLPKLPQLPAPPSPPNIISTGQLSPSDVNALRQRGDALSDQISSAVSRRNEVRSQLRHASGLDKTGLEQRLGVLDARIARLEADIDQNSAQLSSLAASRAIASTRPFNIQRPDMSNNLVPVSIVFTIFVLCPIALSISRFLWKRGSTPKAALANAENAQRLERMEHAIDSIAIEMERVSEGQRFVTRILAEGKGGQAIGQGMGVGDKVAVPR